MNFLDFRNNYLQLLQPEELATLLQQNPLDQEEALIDIEATAMSIIEGHLSSRFDLRGLGGRKYRQSLTQLKEWAAQIAAFLLFDRAGRPAPASVQTAYGECIAALKMIGEGKMEWLAPQASSTKGTDWLTNGGIDLEPDDLYYPDMY